MAPMIMLPGHEGRNGVFPGVSPDPPEPLY
jgi:hypothetical protein